MNDYPVSWDEIETKYGFDVTSVVRGFDEGINRLFSTVALSTGGLYTGKEPLDKKEMVDVPNRANRIHSYMLGHWPQLINEKGVWVVGSTAYMLSENREPRDNGDLDLICQDAATVERVCKMIGTSDQHTKTYMGGERIYSGGRQVDVWPLNKGQTIDDAILGFSSTHPQARVAYELATGKLTVYPNENCT
jgi:hypothetical protein